MSRPIEVIIDLAALRHNFAHIRTLVKRSQIMAIIKADAYGHGLIKIAQTLDQADAFGVACLEEGQQLRQAGIKQRIILLEAPYSAEELFEITDLALDIVIHDSSQIEMLERSKLSKSINIWLKLDTGMHRLGFIPESASLALSRLQRISYIQEICLMTHLACANNPDNPITQQQMDRFNHFSHALNMQKTIANSAAVINYPQTHVEWVRPGIMLYGVSPFSDKNGLTHGLRPVMTLTSRLIAVKQIKAGEAVGYGADWHCPQDMHIGIIAAGYGDGYPRQVAYGTPVLVNNKRVPLIGKVSMGMLTVDLREQPHAKVGDVVTLWGKGLAVEEIANCANTIPYALLSNVQKRLKLTYVED